MENLLTEEQIMDMIELNSEKVARYDTLLDYYKGKHKILEKTVVNNENPNNQVVNNYASYITDLQVGYFLAKPIAYRIPDNDMNEMVDDIFADSDEHDLNVELAKDCSLYGEAFEIMYLNEEGSLKLARLNPRSIIPIYSDTIERRLVGAIRYYQDLEDNLNVEVYTDEHIEYWTEGEDGFSNEEIIEHYFGEVPINHYINNEELMGDFEQVISLIDDYNARVSSNSDDLEYFSDAYLMLKGMSGTTAEDLTKMRESKAFLVEPEGDVDFVTKGNAGTAMDNHLELINNNIHKFSKTPDLNDEAFSGNLSGVAIRYKLLSMEQVTGIKERKFTKTLKKRLRILVNYLNIKNSSDFEWRDIEPTFVRNVPDNVLELSEIIKNLIGTVPTETLVSLLPFVEDPVKELKLLKAEEENGVLSYEAYQELNPNTENEGLGSSTIQEEEE